MMSSKMGGKMTLIILIYFCYLILNINADTQLIDWIEKKTFHPKMKVFDNEMQKNLSVS